MGAVTRSPYVLAALASAAVPGLDPAAVALLPVGIGSSVEAALIEDTHGRRWVVRAPLSGAAGAELEASAAVTALLARRLPVGVPAVRGFVALPDGGRAAVHAALPGSGIDLTALDPDDALVGDLGRLIATIHNLDPALYDEAGLASYTSEDYRQRRLADLDRAASTGRVPTALLSRWEQALEDTAVWRFAPTPVHGGLEGRHVLVTLGDDGATASIRGLVGWRRAKVADPADDFAAIVRDCAPETATAVARAYAHGRAVRPDRYLLDRAHLVAELGYVSALVEAMAAGYPDHVEAETQRLRRLEEALADTDPIATSVAPRLSPAPPTHGHRETTAEPDPDAAIEADVGAEPDTGEPTEMPTAEPDPDQRPPA